VSESSPRGGRALRLCSREGCDRQCRSEFCSLACKAIGQELDRLLVLYGTAADPQLSRDAWVELVECSDALSRFKTARSALVREIKAAGLPLP
jgi:hypothetical protein